MKSKSEKDKLVKKLLQRTPDPDKDEDLQEENEPTDFDSYQDAVDYVLNKAKNFKPKTDGNN
tara:strand:- start:393 stop:578 length:186 start_codon:yes stop_codon:yes gene_type:complete